MQIIDDQKPYIEYIDGARYPKVSPKRLHSAVQRAFILIFERCVRGKGFFGPEWRVHLSDRTTLVPDVAFVSAERMKGLPDEALDEPAFAPDIIVEVRSPSDRQSLIERKTQEYLRHGSTLVINADPQTRSLTAHFSDQGVQSYSERDTFSCIAIPWLRFDVREAFSLIDLHAQ